MENECNFAESLGWYWKNKVFLVLLVDEFLKSLGAIKKRIWAM